jgi:uncharacterized protein
MTISIYWLAVGTFVPKLESLSRVLAKGADHARAQSLIPTALAAAALAPDMFALARQVQLACDHARDTAARLAGTEAPKYDNVERTLDELRVRIARTIEFIQRIPESDFAGAEQRNIKRPLLNNRVLEMNAVEFLRDWALPQFFFHVVTAYGILRHNGVGIGKWDYLGDLSGSIHQRDVA